MGRNFVGNVDNIMNERIDSELKLLRLHYANVEYKEENNLHWFKVGNISTPKGWSPSHIHVIFFVTQGHPGTQPYGFFVPAELKLEGQLPSETSAKHQPPFPENWRFLSWQPVNWHATSDVCTGDNLWGWVRSFLRRLEEGL